MTHTSANRWLWWLPFLAASAVFSAWASFTSQQLLGHLMNWEPAWLMPAILDNLVIGTAVAFILLPGWATWATSVAVLGVSAFANAQAHYYDPRSADLGIPTGWAIFWSVLPLAAMFTIEHFIVATRRTPDVAATVDSDAGATDTDSDDPLPRMGADGGPADTKGSRDSGTRPAGSPARRRATKTTTRRTRTGGRGPTGPDVDTVAADIRRLGIHSKRAAKAHFGIGDDKVNQPVVVAALTANNNGH